MAKLFCKLVIIVGLLMVSVPGWGSQSQQKQSKPPARTEAGQNQQLPEGGSELPLLSVIGMGILSGGILSAMRTRPARG
jgi:hypothetical protein